MVEINGDNTFYPNRVTFWVFADAYHLLSDAPFHLILYKELPFSSGGFSDLPEPYLSLICHGLYLIIKRVSDIQEE